MLTHRVVIGDDHELIVEGIRRVLAAQNDYEVVGVAGNGMDLVRLVLSTRPDVVLLDVSMPVMNGIEAARQIRRSHPQCKLIFVTQRSDVSSLREALDAGGSGYILKQSVASEVATAIQDALSGRYYLSSGLRTALRLDTTGETVRMPGVELTPRQRQVLQLIAEGKSNKEIAALLQISVRTIEFHKAGLVSTLSLRTVAELTRYAIERGIVDN
jgi:DNA-binding NarL/FixJ family response regulator